MKMIDASNIFSSVNSSGVRESEASCWRLRRQRPKSAAANMPLWTPFLFKRPHFTKTTDTGRFLPSKNIPTPANGTVFQTLGKAVFSMVVSIMRQLFVLIPAAYILARIGGLHMVWWSFPIAEVISFAVSVTFLVRIYQMIIKKIPNEE